MSESEASKYVKLVDTFNILSLKSNLTDEDNLRLESLSNDIDEIWQKLNDTEKREVQAKLQVTE
jgi:hypothetical protein